MMSLQLDMRAHCEVSRVQGEGETPALSNGGTWRAGATLMAALAWTLQSRDSYGLTKHRELTGGAPGRGAGRRAYGSAFQEGVWHARREAEAAR